MLSAKQTTNNQITPYATAVDFCRIFEEDMNGLYLLSLLLTADSAMAEQCFVRGLDDAIKSNRVFQEWSHSWARRTVIQNAIQLVQPRPTDGRTHSSAAHIAGVPREVAGVLELTAFERFAFVMSVLERYSDQVCALLLHSTRAEVSAARRRALQQLGESAELHSESAASRTAEVLRGEDSRPALLREPLRHLAVSV